MSTLTKHKPAKATKVWFSDIKLFVLLDDGREIGVPLVWFPKLRDADEIDLKKWHLIGNGIGIHWEALDEDISVEGRGKPRNRRTEQPRNRESGA